MNMEKTVVKGILCRNELSQLQYAESEFILPDYYADISKILKCNFYPLTEAVSVSGDKISVAGILKLSVLYTGEDNKLYNFENEIKYTKVFQGQSIQVNDYANVSQSISTENCRALGPKRIEVKAGIQVNVEIVSFKEYGLISCVNEENIFSRTYKKKILMPVNSIQKDFSVSINSSAENISYSDIACVIRKACKYNIEEIKPITNKLFVKGNFEVRIFYLTSDNRILSHCANIPFSEVIDLYQLKEDDICNLRSLNTYVDFSLKDDGENRCSFNINVFASVNISASRSTEINYISDIYASDFDCESSYDEIEITESEETNIHTCSFDYEAEIYDSDGEIIDSYIDSLHIASQSKDDSTIFSISGNYNALIHNRDGGFYLVSRSFLFDEEHNIGTSAKCGVKILSCDVLSVSALRSADNKIRFKSDFNIKYLLEVNCKEKMLSAFDVNKSSFDGTGNRMILYYGKKNEDIWEIAKENKASVVSLKELNSIDEEILSEDRVLLLTNF